jgi:CDGSH-type Zn-finger protein
MLNRRLTQTPLQRFQITPPQLVCAMAHVKIETIKNGPYIVTGEVELIDADGNKFSVEKRMALCRCGASTEKPFCDGTHSKIGFKAAEKAVPESKE